MKLAIAMTLMLTACGSSDGPPAPDATAVCSVQCPGLGAVRCNKDGQLCACSTGPEICELDSCDDRDDSLPYCSDPAVGCADGPVNCTYDGACECLRASDGMPVDCRTDSCRSQ